MSDIDMRKGYDPVRIMIYDRKKDVLSEETSLIAIDREKHKLVAAGNDAIPYADDAKSNVLVLSPLKKGVIADFMLAQMMFQYMLHKGAMRKPLLKPRIAVSIPIDCTDVERKAFQDVFYQAGAKEVFLTKESLAEMKQTLPSSYGILIEIDRNEEGKQVGQESWKEVCQNQIPAGSYHTVSFRNQELDLLITLQSDTDCVQILFHKVLATRMLEKKVIPDYLFSEDEKERFRKEAFKNVIYQIVHGEFSDFIINNENRRGRAWGMQCKHYLLMTKQYTIEILSDKEPEIVCSKR